MAQLSKPPIPLKMYKHFAFATVALTAGIAMFADSDNRQTVGDHLEERERQQEWQVASAEITAPPALIRNDPQSVGSFGGENAGPGGSGTAVSRGGGGDGGYGPARAGQARGQFGSGRLMVPGYDRQYIDSLSDVDYRAFVESLTPELRARSTTAEERATQRAAIEAASARRAGRNGPGADAPG